MYALAIIRYRRPLEEVARHTEAHRTYLGRLKSEGTLLASGPLDPRNGGAALFHVPDGPDLWTRLDALRDGDPYVQAGVAQYEVLPWAVATGREDLDRLWMG
ncbi:MAG: hypothetical protein HY823_02740 [Acidobacteria bacterium]|nr:hypothetical protein [Acidobacteriota bacterium]